MLTLIQQAIPAIPRLQKKRAFPCGGAPRVILLCRVEGSKPTPKGVSFIPLSRLLGRGTRQIF